MPVCANPACSRSVRRADEFCSLACAQQTPGAGAGLLREADERTAKRYRKPRNAGSVMDRLYDEITVDLDPFQRACLESGLPVPKKEYEFSGARNYRADYCWPDPDQMLILEVEGGVWKKGGGRHNRASGFLNDVQKYNLAACEGYRLIRTVPNNLLTAETLELVRLALLA